MSPLAAGNSPSHRTMARFRQENIDHFKELFVQVVQVAMSAGLVNMGTLAIDGSKVKANASKHKAMTYARMKSEESRISTEIERITEVASGLDEAEDGEFGPDFRGDELPEELHNREARRAKIRESIKALEDEQTRDDDESGHGEQQKKSGRGRPRRPNGVPPDKKQRNFTDPESRIMGSPQKGFMQGYNGQIAVDAEEQIVVAQDITQCAADNAELIPMIKQATENTGISPRQALADAGYRSEPNFKELERLSVDGHVSLGKGEQTPAKPRHTEPATVRMHRKRQTKRSRKIYKRRKAIVEPVFGWIKSVLGFRSFSMRGVENVRGEWSLVCLALNLKRMGSKMEWSG